MLLKSMIEILWTEAFGNSWRSVEYSSVSVPREKAEIQTQEQVFLLEEIRKTVERAKSGHTPLFVKLTAGRFAGSIAQVTTIPYFNTQNVGNKPTPPRVTYFDNSSYRTKTDAGQFTIEGHLYLYDWRDGGNVAIAEIDGRKILEWSMSSPSLKSSRPALLIGYTGPTVLNRSKKGEVAETAIKLFDRYGQPVVKGDLVIVGNSKTGDLYVGKLQRFTDARTMFVKHIGASEPVKLLNVQDNQLLRITDMDELKKLLMIEKLRSL